MRAIARFAGCEEYANVPADRLVCDGVCILAYDGDTLVGAFNQSSVDMVYLCGAKEEQP